MGDKEFSRRNFIGGVSAAVMFYLMTPILKASEDYQNNPNISKENAQRLFDYARGQIVRGNGEEFFYSGTRNAENFFKTEEIHGLGFKIAPIKSNNGNELYIIGYLLKDKTDIWSSFAFFDKGVDGICDSGKVIDNQGLELLLPKNDLDFLGKSQISLEGVNPSSINKAREEILQTFYDNTLYFLIDNLKI